MCYLRIRGYGSDIRLEDPKDISILILQSISNLSLWSYESLRELYVGINYLIHDFCKKKRDCCSGSKRAQYTRTMNKTRNISFIPNTRQAMLYHIYNSLLAAEGYAPLRGYGFTNRFGDGLKGNPEFHRMSKVYYD